MGVPISDATVLFEHKGGEKKEVKTGSKGYYEVLFHLHNDNLGDEIVIKFGDTSKKHKVSFDPDDTVSHRGAEVDFGAPGKEGAKIWIYITAGTLVVFVPVLYFGFFRKSKKPQIEIMEKKRERKKKKKRKKR